MNFKLLLIIVLFSIGLNPAVNAQDTLSNGIVTEQIWLDYNISYYQAEMVLFLKGDWLSFNDGVYIRIGLELF